MVAYTKETNQHAGMDWGGAHEAPFLAEALLAINGYWGGGGNFSSGVWLLVGCPYSSRWPHTMHLLAVPTRHAFILVQSLHQTASSRLSKSEAYTDSQGSLSANNRKYLCITQRASCICQEDLEPAQPWRPLELGSWAVFIWYSYS